VASPPIENGALLVRDDRVGAVGVVGELARPAGAGWWTG
jgi:hypothetical protein